MKVAVGGGQRRLWSQLPLGGHEEQKRMEWGGLEMESVAVRLVALFWLCCCVGNERHPLSLHLNRSTLSKALSSVAKHFKP